MKREELDNLITEATHPDALVAGQRYYRQLEIISMLESAVSAEVRSAGIRDVLSNLFLSSMVDQVVILPLFSQALASLCCDDASE